MLFRIYKGAKLIFKLSADNAYCAYFRNAVNSGGKSRGFKVKSYYLSVKWHIRRTVHRLYSIINIIRFQPVNRFEFVILQRFDSIHNVRKSLNDAMIGNRNSTVTPFISTFDYFVARSNAVHLRHICVHMKFKAFFLLIVCAVYSFYLANIPWSYCNIVVIFIKRSFALHKQSHTRLECKNIFCIFLLRNYFKRI